MIQTNDYKVIIIEKNRLRKDYLKSLFSEWGATPICFEKETVCLDNLIPINPDLVIFGTSSSNETFRFINSIKMINDTMPIVIFSDYPNIHEFINTNGFKNVFVIKKSFQPAEIKKIITNIQDNKTDIQNLPNNSLLVGISSEITSIKKMLSKIVLSREPVLIEGEKGTGKELLARNIYLMSGKKKKPFLKIQSKAISSKSFDNELNRLYNYSPKDEMEIEDGGTIFIAEINELSLALQARFLHIIDSVNKSEIPNGLRIISSSDSDLDNLVEMERFRTDLYHRLNVIKIKMPPLRDRTEDIPLLVDFFTDKFCSDFGRSCFDFPNEVKENLCHYSWPGNIEELENLVKNVVLYGIENSIIDKVFTSKKSTAIQGFTKFFQDIYSIDGLVELKSYLKDINNISLKNITRKTSMRIEELFLRKALEITGWNQKKSAKLLDISYKSLTNKIKIYGLKKNVT